jgi:hypothetical protein
MWWYMLVNQKIVLEDDLYCCVPRAGIETEIAESVFIGNQANYRLTMLKNTFSSTLSANQIYSTFITFWSQGGHNLDD